jgi:hypothetical protein
MLDASPAAGLIRGDINYSSEQIVYEISHVLKDSVMKGLLKILFCLMVFVFLNCNEHADKNMVPIDQLNIDNSNNYRYIFKKTIEKENWRKNRYKRDEFQE